MKSLSLALVTMCSLGSICTAQFVPGVVTTSGMGTFGTYNILNLTNGVGLSSMTLSGTHSNVWQDMWITNAITTGWVQFDLGSIQPLNAIAVWNYNSSISTQRGVRLMDVSLSTDGINFTLLSQETVPQATASTALPPHLIGVGGVPVRYVKFDVLQNWGNNYTGLSEVQFEAGTGGVVGANTNLGQGCIRSVTSFYEFFATSAAFDLANSAISMVPISGGYLVVPGATSYVAPSASAVTLALTDNSELAVALATPFPYAGGSATSLYVCSNGFVSVATGNGVGTTPAAATMLSAPQTGWWAWHNYNPAAVGSGQVKVEQAGGVAYITWDGVYDQGGTTAANASTFQFQFDASGTVHLVFQTMSALGNSRLVGYSPGGASVDPGNTDLSVALPGTLALGATDILPLALSGGTRPVIGTNWTLNVGNVPAGGVIGLDVFGLVDPNIVDLGFLGAPGCGLRATLDLLTPWVVAGASHSYALPLPLDPSLVNQHVYTQAVVLQPGVNALLGGAITSNGIDGKIGNL